jgi:neutral ceramidase
MAPLQAGVAEVDITPPLGTTLAGSFTNRPAHDVDDPLRAKALVMDDGTVQVALVVLDLVGLTRPDVQAVRELVNETTGIPPAHVLIGCTHTHTGPAMFRVNEVEPDTAYSQWLVVRVADSVSLAMRRLRPARIAWGRGEAHGISFSRRYRMRNGHVQMNPGRGNPNIVEPTSPIDPAVGVLLVETCDGQLMSVVAQFSLHYVGTNDGRAISADYYGHFDRFLRRIFGPSCIPMLFNGTSGQINNVNVFDLHQESGHQQAKRVAGILGGEVLKVLGRMTPQTDIRLLAASQLITLPRKKLTPEDLTTARAILAGQDPDPQSGPFSWVVGQPIPAALRPMYAHECLLLDDLPDQISTEVQAIRIGESAWVGLPGEIFTEIGLAIKQAAPCPHTFVIGLANDCLAYIPTDKAFEEEGGYETWAAAWNPVGVGAEGILVDTATALLQNLFAD